MKGWLFLFVASACFSCAAPQADFKVEQPQIIDQVLEQSTEMMVHDVTNPPLAARFYAYICLAGFQTITLFEPSVNNFSDSLNNYRKYDGPVITDADPGLSTALAMAEVAASIQPSGTLMRDWIKRFKDSCLDEGCSASQFDSSLKLSKRIADHVMVYARQDGYSKLSALSRFTPGKVEGQWYPTPPGYFAAVEPYFSRIRPFTLDTANLLQYSIPPPIAYSNSKQSAFYQAALAVYDADKKGGNHDIAAFWDCNPFALSENGHLLVGLKKISPGAHWMGIAGIAAKTKNLNLFASVQLRAVVSICMMDAFWLCWRVKYLTNRIRPETAIRKLIDPTWKPFLQTPPFPEYPSGHSVVSTVAAEVLTTMLGDGINYTDTVERRYGLPDRKYSSFYQAAEEASRSRFFGGIHFMDGITNGQQLGKMMGKSGLQKLGLK